MHKDNYLNLLQQAKTSKIDLWVEQSKLKFKSEENAFSAELKEQIIASKQKVINWLAAQEDRLSNLIVPVNNSINTLTTEQMMLWRAAQFAEYGYEYNIPYAFILEGEIDADRLVSALEMIVRKNVLLQAKFHEENGVVYQTVMPDFKMPIHQLCIEDNEAIITSYCEEVAKTVFDLKHGPCFLIKLVKISKLKYLLCFVFHHIVVDAPSISLLFNQFKGFYNQDNSNSDKDTICYFDYAHWQQQTVQIKSAQKIIEKSILPCDKGLTHSESLKGANYKFGLSAGLTYKLKEFSTNNNVSLNATLLTAYFILLRRYSRTDQHCVGLSISTRSSTQKQNLIGPMLNAAAEIGRAHV